MASLFTSGAGSGSPPPGAQSPLPPLPNLSTSPGGGSDPSQQGFLQALMQKIGPVKSQVDQINSACHAIMQSGAIPGAEQVCAQIIGLASQLLQAAAQQGMQAAPSGGSGMNMPPPPGPPQGLGAGGPGNAPPPGGPQ